MHPSSDRAHRWPGTAEWFELFDLLFFSPQGSLGGHLTVLRWPASNQAWYWAAVVRAGQPSAVVVETDLALPADSIELRGSGIWADHICEDPLVHWSYGLEAFALALDDPDEAFAAPPPSPGTHVEVRGERVPLGFDLEWEATDTSTVQLADGFAHPGRVHGVILLGADAYDLDGFGVRLRRWGVGPHPVGLGSATPGRPVAAVRRADGAWLVGEVPLAVPGPRSVVQWTTPAGVPAGLGRTLGRTAEGWVGWWESAQAE